MHDFRTECSNRASAFALTGLKKVYVPSNEAHCWNVIAEAGFPCVGTRNCSGYFRLGSAGCTHIYTYRSAFRAYFPRPRISITPAIRKKLTVPAGGFNYEWAQLTWYAKDLQSANMEKFWVRRIDLGCGITDLADLNQNLMASPARGLSSDVGSSATKIAAICLLANPLPSDQRVSGPCSLSSRHTGLKNFCELIIWLHPGGDQATPWVSDLAGMLSRK